MSNYAEEYYFVRLPREQDKLPFLVPDKNTEDRNFRFMPQPMGSPPLVFSNAAAEENRRTGNYVPTPEILFAGADLLVRSNLRDRLLQEDIDHLHMHPAVYIDDKGNWHEDYWYLTFSEQFDCWDRAASDYEQDDDPVRLAGKEFVQVYEYSLDRERIDAAPLGQRKLFKMDGDLNGFVVSHQSLLPLFQSASGAWCQRVSDY